MAKPLSDKKSFHDDYVHPEKGLSLSGYAMFTVHRVLDRRGQEVGLESPRGEIVIAIEGSDDRRFYPEKQPKAARVPIGFIHPLQKRGMGGSVTLRLSFPGGGPKARPAPDRSVTLRWQDIDPQRLGPTQHEIDPNREPKRFPLDPLAEASDAQGAESVEVSGVTASLDEESDGSDEPGESDLALGAKADPAHPNAFYSDGDKDINWANWGCTSSAKPALIFSDYADGLSQKCQPSQNRSPVTEEDVKYVVGLAIAQGLKIRTFGSSHSWTPYTSTDGVLVDTRCIDWDAEEGRPRIEPPYQAEDGRWLCRFSPGVTTGELERALWSMAVAGGPAGFSLPTSTFEDVFTMGGILATASHGTGMGNATLSDWVEEMEIVTPDLQLTKFSASGPVPALVAAANATLSNDDIMAAVRCNLGALGIIWSITMEVEPRYYSYWVTARYPIEEFFEDTDDARSRLFKLQQEWDSVEFFYLPATLDLQGVHSADFVTAILSRKVSRGLPPLDYENPAGGTYTELFPTQAPYDAYWAIRFAVEAAGAVFMHPAMKIALHDPLSYWMIPSILATHQGGFMPTPHEKCLRARQWRANHTVNSLGAVEPMRVVDIEWAVPFRMVDPKAQAGPLTDADTGMWAPNRVMGHLIEQMQAAWNKPPAWAFWDPDKYPVTTAAEMRLFSASHDVLLSPESSWNGYEWFAAPEIISHTGTPAWADFMEQMHQYVSGLPDLQVKTHIAKQGWEMPGFLGWLRDRFRLLPRDASNHFDVFEKVRAAIDPSGVFLSPMLEQWLTTNDPTLNLDPAKFPVDATGYVDLPDGTSLTWKNHFPHEKTFP